MSFPRAHQTQTYVLFSSLYDTQGLPSLPGTPRFRRFLATYPQLAAEPQSNESLARRYNSRVPAGKGCSWNEYCTWDFFLIQNLLKTNENIFFPKRNCCLYSIVALKQMEQVIFLYFSRNLLFYVFGGCCNHPVTPTKTCGRYCFVEMAIPHAPTMAITRAGLQGCTICAYVHIFEYVHIYIYIYILLSIYRCIMIYIYIDYIQIYIYTYIYIYILDTYMHISI